MKLVMLSGLPASGKSTKARKIMKDGGYFRVNRDLLREMLHFDKWSGYNERVTINAQNAIVANLLNDGNNVIVDDTNLTSGHRSRWSNLAKDMDAKFEVVKMDVPLEECLARNSLRNDAAKIREDVLWGMAIKNGFWRPKKGIVLCDIDGTLADVKHRLHFVKKEKKDWMGFFEAMGDDTVIDDSVKILNAYKDEGYDVFIVSGRPNQYRVITEAWLLSHDITCNALFMRGEFDKRPDTETKYDILKFFDNMRDKIKCVIDDRPSVIRMWEKENIKVIDVGDGKEF